MKYDFNKQVERRYSKSIKWNLGDRDILPMWVADMDFEVPIEIAAAVKARAEHPIYGYTIPGEQYYSSIINWWEKRHSLRIEKQWISYSPGVVPAVNMLIRAFTKPGDKVLVQTPVYYPFFSAIKNNGCELVENPLKPVGDRYEMDFEDLERKLTDPDVKVMILCSPHNPVGRVWSKEELSRVGELCVKNDVLVIADEIHCDLVYKKYKHTPFLSLNTELAEICAMCTAPSKTFNIAGLQVSSVIIPNETLRGKFNAVLESDAIMGPNIFAIEALEAAYNHGELWLEELIDYLQGNLDYLKEFINVNLPELKLINPEGTYLVWLDCSTLKKTSKELHEFFMEKAKVWFDEGYIFGSGGESFQRINIACPRTILEEALRRLQIALKANG